jgi:hypothetical protein
MDTRTKRIVGWTAGIGAILVASIGSLSAIPSGGGGSSPQPIPLSATTSAASWAGLDPGRVIPANIERSILIPASASVAATHNANPYGSEYDAWLDLRTSIAPGRLEAFFAAALPDEGWHVASTSTSRRGFTLIASKAGSDGSYWEVGIKDPVAGPGGSELQVRLLQVSFS